MREANVSVMKATNFCESSAAGITSLFISAPATWHARLRTLTYRPPKLSCILSNLPEERNDHRPYRCKLLDGAKWSSLEQHVERAERRVLLQRPEVHGEVGFHEQILVDQSQDVFNDATIVDVPQYLHLVQAQARLGRTQVNYDRTVVNSSAYASPSFWK